MRTARNLQARNVRARSLRAALAAFATAGAVLTFTLGGCASTDKVSVSDPQLQGTWRLAAASDHGLGIPLGGKSITLTIGDAKHTGGDSPCSTYSASVTGGVGVVYIRARLTGGARDDCATTELNNIEKNYLDALTSSRYARVDEGSLTLSSPKSNLVFVKAVNTPIVAILNSSWRLYALRTQVPSDIDGPGLNPVYLHFDRGTELTITSPCGTFTAKYQIKGENFAVSMQRVTVATSSNCTAAERSLAADAEVLLDGPLLIDVNSAGEGDPATLVVTNLNDDVPVVWRATQ